ncbi:MAG: hypothetical protein HY064_15050 [Bacteroidetes bacterium]|nr:hypothetical protein [Bacteroidota bacterium]
MTDYRFLWVIFFAFIFSCSAPKDIAGDYYAKIDDSLYKIYHFTADKRFDWDGIYQGNVLAQDSGSYFMRNDSIFFCSDDSSSSNCDGMRISCRMHGTFVLHFLGSYIRTCGTGNGAGEVTFKEKLILKKLKPKD